MHRSLRRGAERAEQGQYLLLLDQPPGRLDRLWRTVSIIHGEEFHLASIDAAVFVQHPEIGLAHPTQYAIERAGTAMRHSLSKFDFGVARARIVFFLAGGSGSGGRGDRSD